MRKAIVVPIDFSPQSMQALEYAIGLYRPLAAELVLLHAVEPIYFAATGGTYGVGFDASIVYRELEDSARRQLSAIADRVRARRVPVRILLAVGRPSIVIADAAKKLKAECVVMSTHGRTGLSHALMGSVAEHIVRTAPCPVLTVRPRPQPTRRAPRRARKPARQRALRATG